MPNEEKEIAACSYEPLVTCIFFKKHQKTGTIMKNPPFTMGEFTWEVLHDVHVSSGVLVVLCDALQRCFAVFTTLKCCKPAMHYLPCFVEKSIRDSPSQRYRKCY